MRYNAVDRTFYDAINPLSAKPFPVKNIQKSRDYNEDSPPQADGVSTTVIPKACPRLRSGVC